MNKNQKTVAVIVSLFLLAMLFYPPFAIYRSGAKFSIGWHFIGDRAPRNSGASIDVSTLFIEYLIVLTIGGIVFFIFKDVKKEKGGD